MAKKPATTMTRWMRTASVSEVVRMARAMEAGAIKTYTLMARAAENPVTRAKLRYLVEEERRHKHFLDALARTLPPSDALPVKGVTEVPDMPASVALDRLIEKSLDAEARAEVFYRCAARRCRAPEARRAFQILADMERRHADLLRQELRALRGEWGWSSLEGQSLDEEDFWGAAAP